MDATKPAALHGRILSRHKIDYSGHAAQFAHLGNYFDRIPERDDLVGYLMTFQDSSARTVINIEGIHE